jgi:putative phage-type endonuclease
MFQETVSLDRIIDKCIHVHMGLDETLFVVHNVFSHLVDVSYIENRIKKTDGYKKQLEYLKSLPIIEQRTEIWYQTRQTLITASDFAQALDEAKFGTKKQLLIKKAGYDEETFDPNLPPLKWGTMFEQVACDLYKMRNVMNVYEFGLIKHPEISHFGASPDGITSMGVMLEIKCPYKRKVDGTIPTQYFYQIQGQLEVCGLHECDYLECEFELICETDFLCSDYSYKNMERGIILEYFEDNKYSYKYSPIATSKSDNDYLKSWIDSASGKFKTLFWRLKVYNTVRVYKDEDFIQEKLPCVAEVWDVILKYRTDKDLYMKDIGDLLKEKKSKKHKQIQSTSKPVLAGYCFMEDN